MEHWDPQMMLDLYIHNYLIRKNMPTTAEIFAREANFYPKPVAIDTPEGFLSEWWSLFWSVYSAKYPYHPEATESSLSKITQNAYPVMPSRDIDYMLQDICPMTGIVLQNAHLVMPSRDVDYMLQDICHTTESVPLNAHPVMPRRDVDYMLQDICSPTLQTISQTIVPRPDEGNLLQIDLSRMMVRPELRLPISDSSVTHGQTITDLLQRNLSKMMPKPELGLPISDSSVTQGETITNLIAARIHEQERLGFPVGGFSSDSQILNVDQLACVLPSSINSSHPQEKVYQNPQLSVTRDNKFGASLMRSVAADPTRHSAKAIQPTIVPANTGSRMREQQLLKLPVKNLNSNSQIFAVDQLAHLLPSSSNCSQHKEKVSKKPLLSVARGEKAGTCLRRSPPAEPTGHPPKVVQPKMEPADTDTRIHQQEHLLLPIGNLNSNSLLVDIDQLAPLLPSSNNCSHLQKNKKRQLSFPGDDKCGTSLRRSTAAEPAHHASKAIQPKIEPADTDSRVCEQECLKLPVRDLKSNSQLLDIGQLARLLSSSSNSSLSQKNICKKSQHSVTRVEGCGTSLRRSAAEPTCHAQKAIQTKKEPADFGSSTSSNSTSSEPRF